MKNFLRPIQYCIVASTLGLLGSCAHVQKPAIKQSTAADYLQLAQRTQGINKQTYQLKAIDAYLASHRIIEANNLIDRLSTSLPPLYTNLVTKLRLQKIQAALAAKQTYQAMTMLEGLSDPQSFSIDNKKRYYQLFAKAYLASGDIINSVNMRSQLSQLLTTPEEKKHNLWVIWSSLQKLDTKQLQADELETPSQNLRGWLTLALLTKQKESQPTQLTAALSDWQSQYPDHPANHLLPKKVLKTQLPPSPQKIALLVPLTGSYAQYGQAIKNGFFAAYFDQKKRLGITPTIRVYDTAKGNINNIYQKAISQHANFVVGPLQKQNVRALLSQHNLSVPTLSLNAVSSDADATNSNLYEFGLSPTDEATQAAQQAWKNHHQRIIIIAKNDAWSKTMVDAFTQQWQQLGGKITATTWFGQQNQFSKKIRSLLGIDHAYQEKHTLQNILKEKMRFIPRRRKDFDGIFLVAPPQSAKQLLPLLKFYFAKDIPVYTTSQIYRYNNSRIYNRDLNGVFFCDIPWLLDHGKFKPQYLSDIRQRVRQLWAKQFKKLPRFFALGVDAFDITHKLNKMIMLPKLGTLGATGTLMITPTHHIYRELPWAVFKNGTPQRVS